jgi:CRP/FNR family transcriptional regulator, cyclic AMP receptor protein
VLDTIFTAASGLAEITFADGEDVLIEGESQGRLLVLMTGTVEVSREEVLVSIIDEPGAIFGEVAALLSAPATATVRARGQCVFRVCDDPLGFLEAHPQAALAIAEVLARRLDRLTRYLVDVRSQYADRDDHLGMVDGVLESLANHQGAPPDPGSDREREAPY